MIAARLRGMTGGHWLALFVLVLLCWLALFVMAVPSELRAAGRVWGADLIESLCTVTPDARGFLRAALMWTLMAGAMMAPTAFPALATYDELPGTDGRGFARLFAGYLAIWLGFALIAAGAQVGLAAQGLVSAFGDSRSAAFSAALLALAGAYQFSAIKQACASKCRSPLMFFMAHWAEGPWRQGLRLGLVCLGCCWALMALAFVGGVMNLAFMGLAMIVMLTEKLPEIGRWLTRPLGYALLAAAAWVAWAGF